MTTIVVANASKCTANAASIIANYHRTSSARNSRKSTNSFNLPSKAGVKENNINLWHFRTFSTCSAGSPFESDLESVFASPSRCARGSNAGKDVAVVTSSSRSVKTVSNAGSGRSADEFYEPPSLEVMRAQLGPVGSLVANAVEVGFTTASSYISGGLFGYFIGGAMGIPGVLRKEAVNGASGIPPMKSAVPNAGMKEIQRRIGDWNSKALAQGKSWGALSASFSGFHALARVCRGGVEDKWNSILGSAATGAYLSRQGKIITLASLLFLRAIYSSDFSNVLTVSSILTYVSMSRWSTSNVTRSFILRRIYIHSGQCVWVSTRYNCRKR